MMVFNHCLSLLIILCWFVAGSLQQQTCQELNLEITTDMKSFNQSDMAYVRNGMNITCSFYCESTCVNNRLYLTWFQNGESVYSIYFRKTLGDTGPAPAFADKVEWITANDTVDNTYVLHWLETSWEDVSIGTSVEWTCTVGVTPFCNTFSKTTHISYFAYPLQFWYEDEQLINSSNCQLEVTAEAKCSVISHPDSQVIMMRGDEVLSGDSSCSNFSQYESVCSVRFENVNFADGLRCEVMYDSPETGAYEEVIPDGDCPTLFPTNYPSSFPGWAIGVICSCAVFGVGITGAVCYYKKKDAGGPGVKHSTENPATENPATKNPTTENPATENPATENPATRELPPANTKKSELPPSPSNHSPSKTNTERDPTDDEMIGAVEV